jgi:hypothetical protein
MKMSRFSLLLAVALFVAPVTVFGEDNSGTKQENVLTKEQQEAADKLAADKLAADKLAADKLAADKLAADKLAADKLAADKLAADKLAADKLAADKLAADKLAADKAKEAGIFAAIAGFITTIGKTGDKGIQTIADWTFIDAALKKLASFESLKGGKFQDSIPAINRVIVSTALVAVLYGAYKLYKSQQQEDADNSDIDLDFNDNDKDYNYNNDRYNN